MKIEGSAFGSGPESGFISQRHGSADPDPHQNVMDPEHCWWVRGARGGPLPFSSPGWASGCCATACWPAPFVTSRAGGAHPGGCGLEYSDFNKKLPYTFLNNVYKKDFLKELAISCEFAF
jgi:hypothetical protein